jgi:ketosteroid isomerase-like protein
LVVGAVKGEPAGSDVGHEVAITGRSSMGSAEEAVVLAFNAAINRRDLPGLGRLMADDHRFIDTAGETFAGKPACLVAWRGFFASFPDYRNVFDNVRSSSGGIVEVHGRSECSVAALAGPARWRAVVADGLVVEWRVFDASTDLD